LGGGRHSLVDFFQIMAYRSSPTDREGMPPGVPFIIGNEAAERFSFYGMKAILAVFMVSYLHLMDGHSGSGMAEPEATEKVHLFNSAVYFTPVLGALLADAFWGKYRTIIRLSFVYCLGHLALACMGQFGNSSAWLIAGLGLIALGSGGIKPCVSAHVGDQFSQRNAHLLPKIFNWFYFSINFGALVSMLLTPWLLEWYGPHWAFGVPGGLMALATLVFWLGRKRFVHVPANHKNFIKELFSARGRSALLKLLPLYLFVAMFWALFDQTGSTWIFQSQDMDRNFLGFEWLPSQVQSLNSVFVLTFIPLFAYLVYPLMDRVWRLTPLRKIGIGLFIMVASFALVALIQRWIDGGAKPNISWQILAFALITIAEVMVSIVALEFAYTQSPKTMKSTVMCLYLLAVSAGNLLVAGVNHFIQIPDVASVQFQEAIAKLPPDWQNDPRTVILPGHDGKTGTEDDFIQRLSNGEPALLEIPGKATFEEAAGRVEEQAATLGRFPSEEVMKNSLTDLRDPWGGPITYQILNSTRVRLLSAGPDRTPGTQWDLGFYLDRITTEPPPPASWVDRFHPSEPWLERRKQELGIAREASQASVAAITWKQMPFTGGQTRLQGAAYFDFFTWLMLGTAIAFIPYALVYREKSYLQDSE